MVCILILEIRDLTCGPCFCIRLGPVGSTQGFCPSSFVLNSEFVISSGPDWPLKLAAPSPALAYCCSVQFHFLTYRDCDPVMSFLVISFKYFVWQSRERCQNMTDILLHPIKALINLLCGKKARLIYEMSLTKNKLLKLS